MPDVYYTIVKQDGWWYLGGLGGDESFRSLKALLAKFTELRKYT